MVADVLAIWVAVDIEAECLRQRLPFIVAFKSNKMLAFEPLYHLESVADVIIGQVGGLRVRYRAGGAQGYIVPVDVGLQGVVDECGLLVQLVDELSAERVVMLRAVAVLSDHAVALVEKIGCYVRGVGGYTIERVVDVRLELAASEFPQTVC